MLAAPRPPWFQTRDKLLFNLINLPAELHEQLFARFLSRQDFVLGLTVGSDQFKIRIAEPFDLLNLVLVLLWINIGRVGRNPDVASLIESFVSDIANRIHRDDFITINVAVEIRRRLRAGRSGRKTRSGW